MLTKGSNESLAGLCLGCVTCLYVLIKLWQKPSKRNGKAEDGCWVESRTAGSWAAF